MAPKVTAARTSSVFVAPDFRDGRPSRRVCSSAPFTVCQIALYFLRVCHRFPFACWYLSVFCCLNGNRSTHAPARGGSTPELQAICVAATTVIARATRNDSSRPPLTSFFLFLRPGARKTQKKHTHTQNTSRFLKRGWINT